MIEVKIRIYTTGMVSIVIEEKGSPTLVNNASMEHGMAFLAGYMSTWVEDGIPFQVTHGQC